MNIQILQALVLVGDNKHRSAKNGTQITPLTKLWHSTH